MSSFNLNLPKEKVPASVINPKVLLLYSLPKMGKTSIVAGLEDCLILDLEEGSDEIDAIKIKVESLEHLSALGDKLLEQGKPYKYIAIDTISTLEEWCIVAAKDMYRRSPVYSSKYERTPILSLPKGSGFFWLREAFNQSFSFINKLADHIILLGHLKESEMVTREESNGEVELKETNKAEISSFSIDLIGKDRQIACSKASALGYIYKKVEGDGKGGLKDVRMISFSSREILTGSRSKHLRGKQVKISEAELIKLPNGDTETGEVKTFWENIYKETFFVPEGTIDKHCLKCGKLTPHRRLITTKENISVPIEKSAFLVCILHEGE